MAEPTGKDPESQGDETKPGEGDKPPVEPVKTPEDQPPTEPTPPVVPPAAAMSDDQVASLREEITKDVSGKVSKEVSKSVVQKIGDALGLTKKEEDELPKDAASLRQMVDKGVKEELKKRDEADDDEVKTSDKDRQTQIDGIVSSWYSEYNALATTGKVPAIKDANDQEDDGVKARRRLILEVGKMIEEDKKRGVSRTPALSEVLVGNPAVLSAPPGGDLPISGNTQVREADDSFSYQSDIRKKSIQDIASEGSS